MDEKKAVEIMTRWLNHENELGKKPMQIKVAGSFSYEGNDYIILKFRPKLFEQWQVGVVGFDKEGNECGHTFSEYEKYDKATAEEKCIAMIEYLKEYLKTRAQSELENQNINSEQHKNMAEQECAEMRDETEVQEALRVGCVLLENDNIDFDALCDKLKQAFELNDEDSTREDNVYLFEKDRAVMTISLLSTPVPDKEAEYYAESNFLWDEAVETVKKHKAHLLVTGKSLDGDSILTACFFTGTVNLCVKETGALGIYTTGNVYEPSYYSEWTDELRENRMPIPLWVYVGLIQGTEEEGNSGYTYGMTAFGREEIEIIGSRHTPQEIYNFLYNICDWLLSENMYFCDGETLSLTADQKLTVTWSEAVYVYGESFKIGY